MDDTQITALFFARSEQAVSEAMKRYGSAVWKVSTNILKDRQDVEECYSDTFHAAWNQIPPNKPQFLGAYLCRIARNISLKRYEANTAQKRNGYYDVAMEELEDTIPALATVEQQYDAKELTEYLNRFLWGLSKEDRYLFLHRYWFLDPVQEIGKQLGMSPHSVSVRLFRLRQKLQTYLVKEGMIQ